MQEHTLRLHQNNINKSAHEFIIYGILKSTITPGICHTYSLKLILVKYSTAGAAAIWAGMAAL